MHTVSHSSGACRQLKPYKRANGAARNTHTTVCRLANDQTKKEAKPAPVHHAEEKNIFESIIGTLLSRGASRLERGVATCLECRGTGHATCPQCKGTGRVGPMSRKAIREASLTRHRDSVEKGDQWLVTNRCSCCRGSGNNLCASCEGTGLRVPSLVRGAYGNKDAAQHEAEDE